MISIGVALVALAIGWHFTPGFERLALPSWALGWLIILISMLRHRTTVMRLLGTRLTVQAVISPGPYPPGTKIAGIVWEPHFADARIELENIGPAVVRRIDLHVAFADMYIAHLVQATKIPGVTTDVSYPPGFPTIAGLIGQDSEGKEIVIPILPANAEAGPVLSPAYRISCGELLTGWRLQLVAAITAVVPTDQGVTFEARMPTAMRLVGSYEIPGTKRQVDLVQEIVAVTVPPTAPSSGASR